jgi:hypothetical protein
MDRARKRRILLTKFVERVRILGPDECWEARRLGAGGYGMSVRDGERVMPLHRAAVLLDGREIPDEMDVHHECGNRACANPKHLRVVSRAENLRIDRERRKRARLGLLPDPEMALDHRAYRPG